MNLPTAQQMIDDAPIGVRHLLPDQIVDYADSKEATATWAALAPAAQSLTKTVAERLRRAVKIGRLEVVCDYRTNPPAGDASAAADALRWWGIGVELTGDARWPAMRAYLSHTAAEAAMAEFEANSFVE